MDEKECRRVMEALNEARKGAQVIKGIPWLDDPGKLLKRGMKISPNKAEQLLNELERLGAVSLVRVAGPRGPILHAWLLKDNVELPKGTGEERIIRALARYKQWSQVCGGWIVPSEKLVFVQQMAGVYGWQFFNILKKELEGRRGIIQIVSRKNGNGGMKTSHLVLNKSFPSIS